MSRLFALAGVGLLGLGLPLAAHDLGAQAKLQDGKVILEAYFDDDTAASEAKVRVMDDNGATVSSGTTDDKGTWTFAAPPPGRYRVVVNAGGGHKATIPLKIPNRPGESRLVPEKSETAASPHAEQTISAGPTREQFTRFPWGRLLLGLAVLVGLAGLTYWWLRTRPTAAPDQPPVA
ncbi:MAG: carboxypeptidase-like regulatory domain-containing protein [Gemmataceae bacterium]